VRLPPSVSQAASCLLATVLVFANVTGTQAFDFPAEERAIQTLAVKLAQEKKNCQAAYAEFAVAVFHMAEARCKDGIQEETATPAILAAGKKLSALATAMEPLTREYHNRWLVVERMKEAASPDATWKQQYYAASALAYLLPYADSGGAESLCAEADARFQEAVKAAPEPDSDVYRQWANLLRAFAARMPEKKNADLYAKSAELYAESLKLARTLDEEAAALFNWGHLLQQMGMEKTGKERSALFRDADARYAEAVGKCGAWNSWGDALVKRAKRAKGAERDALFREALRLHARGAESAAKPTAFVLARWSLVLIEYGQILHREKRGKESRALFTEAAEVLRRTDDNRSACVKAKIAALLGNTQECREALNACAENGLGLGFSLKELESGPEWAAVSNMPWFRLALVTIQMKEAERIVNNIAD
jgi:hypothetical protein